MSQWQRICSMCQQPNVAFNGQLTDLYGRINFPIKIRYQCSAWLEAQNWNIDINTEEGRQESEDLFLQLLAQIKDIIDQMKQDTHPPEYEKIMELEIIHNNLKKMFDGNYHRFVEMMRQCLQDERSLLQAFDNDLGDDPPRRDQRRRAMENVELRLKLDAVKARMDAAAININEVDRQQEEFLVNYRYIQAEISNISRQNSHMSDPAQLSSAQIAQGQSLIESRNLMVQQNVERRNEMASRQVQMAIDLALLIKTIWEEILTWQADQRLAITGLAHQLEGSLDVLDKLCDYGGTLLYQMIGQVETALMLFRKARVEHDMKMTCLEKLLHELMEEYLPNYLRRTFVVEQNIADRFLKISGAKSVNFSMSVRMLGGKALGLGFSKPKVMMSVFYETDIPLGDTYVPGMCEIDNGNERPFVVNNACTARFHSVRLKNFKRTNPRGANASEELVTEQKYAVIFYTVINICGKSIPVRVVSLPLIFISQTSQEIMAKGTLIWDAAFSEELREPYKYKDTVRWCEVAALLNSLFLMHTGRGLKEDQLNYLAKMAFKTERNDIKFSSSLITEKQVVKDKLDKRDFSFWKWFWACMNLVKEEVKQEWVNGLIYGFISKEDAREKLIDHPCGTFLLRFSEGNIEPCQKANICGFLTLAVVEKDPATGQKKLFHVKEYLEPRNIQSRKGLGPILDAMEVQDYDRPEKKQLLKYLWPAVNTPFQELFKIEKQDVKATYPYYPAKIFIEIFLGNSQSSRNRHNSIDSVDMESGAGTPGYSANVGSPFSTVSEDDFVIVASSAVPRAPAPPVCPVAPTKRDDSTASNALTNGHHSGQPNVSTASNGTNHSLLPTPNGLSANSQIGVASFLSAAGPSAMLNALSAASSSAGSSDGSTPTNSLSGLMDQFQGQIMLGLHDEDSNSSMSPLGINGNSNEPWLSNGSMLS